MSRRGDVMTISSDSDDSEPQKSYSRLGSLFASSAEPRSQRPAWVSPRAAHIKQPTANSNARYTTLVTGNRSDDSDVEEVAPTAFNFRKSRDDHEGHGIGAKGTQPSSTLRSAAPLDRRDGTLVSNNGADLNGRVNPSVSQVSHTTDTTGPLLHVSTQAVISGAVPTMPSEQVTVKSVQKARRTGPSSRPQYRSPYDPHTKTPRRTSQAVATAESESAVAGPSLRQDLKTILPSGPPVVSHQNSSIAPQQSVAKRRASPDETLAAPADNTKRVRLSTDASHSDALVHSPTLSLDQHSKDISVPSTALKTEKPHLHHDPSPGDKFPSLAALLQRLHPGASQPESAKVEQAPMTSLLEGVPKAISSEKKIPSTMSQEQAPPVVQSIESASLPAPTKVSVTPKLSEDREITGNLINEHSVSEGDSLEPSAPSVTGNSLPLPEVQLRPRPPVIKGQLYTEDDDKLLLHLKEVLHLPWQRVATYFPGRQGASLAVRYSTKLKDRSAGAPASTGTVPESGDMQSTRRGRPRRSVMIDMSTESVDLTDTDTATEPQGEIHRRITRRSHLGPSSLLRASADVLPTPRPTFHTSEMKRVLGRLRQQVSKFSCDRSLRDRELGLTSYRTHPHMLHSCLRDYAYATLSPIMYIEDTSGDVATAAWSPNGRHFAAGCVATSDVDSMQYNKRGNLLIGDASRRLAKELPYHQVSRPIVNQGVNATEEMRATQDKCVYTTVQSVAFSPSARRMFSVSIDGTMKVYKVTRSDVLRTELTDTSIHDGPVDLLSVSPNGHVATGCRVSGLNNIMLFRKGGEKIGFSASKITSAMKKYPSALRFGTHPSHDRYLLAGFACEAERVYEEDEIHDKGGETCLWDIETQKSIELGATNRNVFDLTWNPNPSVGSTAFAVASGVSGRVNRGMHSVVRLYSPSQSRARAGVELECPAWDINDVVYSPYDDNIIAAGSTDGKVYIWDTRQVRDYQGPMQILEHGIPLSVLPHEKPRWETDTGIRFLSWGADHNRLYSGSSDGIVKCWDPYRADEDRHVRDVAYFDSAVMSGAFSPDYDNLLIGEDRCRLNVLSVGQEKGIPQRITVRKSPAKSKSKSESANAPAAHMNSHELVQSGQIMFMPMGAFPGKKAAVQGPNFRGPYNNDLDASELRQQAAQFQESLILEPLATKSSSEDGSPKQLRPDEVDAAIAAVDKLGRFTDRMPDALRKDEPLSPTTAQRRGLVVKCATCGSPARNVEEVAGDREYRALCEKCSFACFRCSKPMHISRRMHAVECESCRISWRMNVLGYEMIDEGNKPVEGSYRAFPSTKVEEGVTEIEPEVWDMGEEETTRQFQAADLVKIESLKVKQREGE
ncbi:hypothetical protein AAFC00_005235 [Neodothiora populina]|uniref:WD40 repeat-like protein n=1 Tax=Neodothiora populina TaxID=2781224 RepID=A0ABR3PKG1_9PEZI